MSDVPGTRFYYNGGNPYVLSALITKKTGKSAFEFAQKELFGPLGIESANWGHTDAQGVTNGESRLSSRLAIWPRSAISIFAEAFGTAKPIIAFVLGRSRERRSVKTYSGFHYANLWWSLPEKGANMAFGHNSQTIIVLPKLDIVAVITGALRPEERYQSRVPRLIDQIASSVKSDQPLPVDPIGQSLLAASLREAANERPSPVGEHPRNGKADFRQVVPAGRQPTPRKDALIEPYGRRPFLGDTVEPTCRTPAQRLTSAHRARRAFPSERTDAPSAFSPSKAVG